MRETKKNRRVIIFCCTMLIVLVIIVPIIINLGLYIPMKTHNSTDGEWLSFWGSFLGGIIGGVSGLIGVILTIRKMEQDRLVEEGKKRPSLIPMNDVIVFFKPNDLSKQQIYAAYDYNMTSDELNEEIAKKSGRPYDNIFIKIINLGEEHAINVIASWKDEYNDKYVSLGKVQVIRGSSSNDLGSITLPGAILSRLGKLVEENYADILKNKTYRNNLGKLELSYQGAKGEAFIKEYTVDINIHHRLLYNLAKDGTRFFINIIFTEA